MCVPTEGQRQSLDTMGRGPPRKWRERERQVPEACVQVGWARSHDGCILVSGYLDVPPRPRPRPLCARALLPGALTSRLPRPFLRAACPLSRSGVWRSPPRFRELSLHAACMPFFRTGEERFLHSFTFLSIYLFAKDMWEPVAGLGGWSGEQHRQAEAPRAWLRSRGPRERGSGTQRQQQRDPREAGLSFRW